MLFFKNYLNLSLPQHFALFLYLHPPRSLSLGWCCLHSRRAPDHSGEISSQSLGHSRRRSCNLWWDNAHSLSPCPLQSAQFDFKHPHLGRFYHNSKLFTLLIVQIHTHQIHFFWKIRKLLDHYIQFPFSIWQVSL